MRRVSHPNQVTASHARDLELKLKRGRYFLTIMAHEVTTPLTANSQFIQAGETPPYVFETER